MASNRVTTPTVRSREIRSRIRRSFSSARNRLSSQREEIVSGLEKAREGVQSRKEELQRIQQESTSQQSLRGQNIRDLAVRRSVTSQIDRESSQLKNIESQIQKAESNVNEKFSKASQELSRLETQSVQKALDRPREIQVDFERGLPEGAIGSSIGGGLLFGPQQSFAGPIPESEIREFVPIQSLPNGKVLFQEVKPPSVEISFEQPKVVTLPSVSQRVRGELKRAGINLPSKEEAQRLINPLELTRNIARVSGEAAEFGQRKVFGDRAVQTKIGRTVLKDELGQEQVLFPGVEVLGPKQTGKVVSLGTEFGIFGSAASTKIGSAIFGLATAQEGGEILFDPQSTKSQRILGGAELALGAGLSAGSVTRYLNEPRLVFRQKPQDPVVSTLSTQSPLLDSQGNLFFIQKQGASGFIPARFEQRASLIRQSFGDFPDPVQIQPRVDFRSTGNIILNEKGRFIGTATTFTGERPIIREFTQTGFIDETTPSNLLKESRRNIISSEESQFFSGRTDFRERFRQINTPSSSGVNVNVLLPRPGRTTTRFSGASEVTPVVDLESGRQLFLVRSASSDITRSATPRNIERSRGLLFSEGQGGQASQESFSPLRLQGSRRQRLKALSSQQEQSVSRLAQREAKRLARSRTKTSPRQRQILEERQTGLNSQVQKISLLQRDRQQTRLSSSTVQLLSSAQSQSLSSAQSQSQEQIQRTFSPLISLLGPTQRTPSGERTSTSQLNPPAIVTETPTLLETPPTTPPTTTPTQPRKPTTPTQPRKQPPAVPLPLPKDEKSIRVLRALQNLGNTGVDVVTGFGNKVRKVYSNLPKNLALKRGLSYVDKNIEASMRLVPSGKRTKQKDIKPFSIGVKFRPSKRNPLVLVEKKKYRLDSPTERRQIRRRKG